MTVEHLRITYNKSCAILRHLVHLMANLVSKNGCFWVAFRTIVQKVGKAGKNGEGAGGQMQFTM